MVVVSGSELERRSAHRQRQNLRQIPAGLSCVKSEFGGISDQEFDQEHPARLADMKKHCENSRPLHRGPSSSSNVAPSAGGSSKQNSTMTSKRPKPDDIDAHAHDQLHKKPKTDEK